MASRGMGPRQSPSSSTLLYLSPSPTTRLDDIPPVETAEFTYACSASICSPWIPRLPNEPADVTGTLPSDD